MRENQSPQHNHATPPGIRKFPREQHYLPPRDGRQMRASKGGRGEKDGE